MQKIQYYIIDNDRYLFDIRDTISKELESGWKIVNMLPIHKSNGYTYSIIVVYEK